MDRVQLNSPVLPLQYRGNGKSNLSNIMRVISLMAADESWKLLNVCHDGNMIGIFSVCLQKDSLLFIVIESNRIQGLGPMIHFYYILLFVIMVTYLVQLLQSLQNRSSFFVIMECNLQKLQLFQCFSVQTNIYLQYFSC